MVVALGALDAHAHENLRGILGELLGVALHLIKIAGGIAERAAARAEQFAHDFIHRLILLKLIAQPLEIKHGVLVIKAVVLSANLQQLGPFHHPNPHELGAGNQLVDELLALGGRFIGHKDRDGLGGGQPANHIKIGAPDERVVIANAAGRDANFLQLIVHELVDVIGLELLGEFEVIHFRNHQHLRSNRDLVVARHDERLAALSSGHLAFAVDLGGNIIVGNEHRLVRDIADGAVAVNGAHDDLLLRAFALEHRLFRMNLKIDHLRRAGGVISRAVLQPAHEGFIERTLRGNHFAAGMRHATGRFLEQQTIVRQGEVNAPPKIFARDVFVIALRIEAKQRQPKTILAARGTVTTAGIATALCKSRHHVEAEPHGAFLGGFLHLHRHGERAAAKLDLQRSLAIDNRTDDVVFKLHQLGIGKGVLRVGGDIARGAVGIRGLHHQLLLGAQRHEAGVLRVHLQIHQILRSGAEQQRRGEKSEQCFLHNIKMLLIKNYLAGTILPSEPTEGFFMTGGLGGALMRNVPRPPRVWVTMWPV